MTDGLEKLFRWTFKYGRIIAYITAAVIVITTAFLVSCYVHPCR